MKICAAQIKPTKGNIEKNIKSHLLFIDRAIEEQVNGIFFSELSLTSYEPTLAKDLAIFPDDNRLDVFQKKSNQHQITIGLGIPTKGKKQLKPYISMVIFQPDSPRTVYSKQYLHVDELPYFIQGEKSFLFKIDDKKIAPAICFESLLPEHAQQSFELGANIYLASVAKDLKNIKKAKEHFPLIAKQYAMTVVMVNQIGPSDNFKCHGCSAVWNEQGELVDQLHQEKEGLLIFDTSTQLCKSISF